MKRAVALTTIVVAIVTVASCGGDDSMPAPTAPSEPVTSIAEGDSLFPDVLAVTPAESDDGSWTFDVTISSPYDTPQRYADAWRVLAPDGTQLGIRELLHDHAGEQPFTRSLSGVMIPTDITEVTVEGRDQLNGWGGATVTLALG